MDMFSTENSSFNPKTSSPRISFSNNLDNSLIDTYPYRSDSSSDFDFCFTGDPIEIEGSSAAELFSNGLIRPNYNKNSSNDGVFRDGFVGQDSLEPKREVLANSHAADRNHNEKRLAVATSSKLENQEGSKDIVSVDGYDGTQSKSFWRIKRSSSLHFESTKHKSSSFWSSLPLLSRSNSTGSVVTKERHNKQNPTQKQSNKNSSSMAVYSSMKPPLKRNYGGGGTYDYGVRISPVLNVPPPFISKNAANLLGLGSFFGHGSEQKNKK